MKTRAFLLTVLLALCPALLYSQWAAVYGGPGDDGANVVRRTPDGGYVIGRWGGLLKMSAEGLKEWDFYVASSTISLSGRVLLTGDGGILVDGADYLSNLYLFKLSAAGAVEWQRNFGLTARVYAISPAADGGAFLAGTINQGSAWNPWVAKVAPGGDVEWQKLLVPDQPSELTLALAASGGTFVAAGRYRTSSTSNVESDLWVVALDSSGGVLWQKTIAWAGDYGTEFPFLVQQTSDGGFLVTAFGDSHSGEGAGPLLVKLGPQGSVEWLRLIDGFLGGRQVRETSDGALVVAALDGTTSMGFNVIKAAPDGTILWQRSYQGTKRLGDYALGLTSDGGFAVAATTDIPIAGSGVDDRDSCLVKLTQTGDIAWQKVLGTPCGWDDLLSLEQTGDAGVIAGGQTRSWGSGGFDAWIVKFTSAGEVNPYCGFIRNADLTSTETTFATTEVLAVVQEPALTVTADPVASELSSIVPGTSNAVLNMLGKPQSTLTLQAYGGGTTNPAPGTSTYATGTSVTVKAIPNSGYNFSGWSGACSSSGSTSANPMTFVMDGDKTVTANFYNPSDGGGGSIDDDWGSGGGGAKKCFIATAAYGSPLHPHVRALREFRDRYLIKSGAGRALVRFYYRVSPPIATFIGEHKAAKTAVRILLIPVVGFAHLALKAGPIPATLALALVLIGGVLFARRRRKARKARARKIT